MELPNNSYKKGDKYPKHRKNSGYGQKQPENGTKMHKKCVFVTSKCIK